jgi:hypothetical protein
MLQATSEAVQVLLDGAASRRELADVQATVSGMTQQNHRCAVHSNWSRDMLASAPAGAGCRVEQCRWLGVAVAGSSGWESGKPAGAGHTDAAEGAAEAARSCT